MGFTVQGIARAMSQNVFTTTRATVTVVGVGAIAAGLAEPSAKAPIKGAAFGFAGTIAGATLLAGRVSSPALIGGALAAGATAAAGALLLW